MLIYNTLQTTTTFILSDGNFDYGDPKFQAKIATYLDLVNVFGYNGKNIAVDTSYDKSIDSSLYFCDIAVFNETLKPVILFDIKHTNEFNDYLGGKYKTNLFEIAKTAEGAEYIKYLILVYPDNSGYTVQNEPVTIDYKKFKTYGAWKKSGFEHLDFIPSYI